MTLIMSNDVQLQKKILLLFNYTKTPKTQMKIAIMQPYIFPYIGYFQLIHAVDKFVFYDDVNFIKGGWVNRNNVLLNGNKNLFTVPLKSVSSFQTIHETLIHSEIYHKWRKKFIKSLEQSYKKSPHFSSVLPLIQSVFEIQHYNITDLTINSIASISNYLELETVFERSSQQYATTKGMEKATRLINICQINQAKTYINPSGGKELYQKETFKKQGIDLYFIENELTPYAQFKNDFIPGLSIIDVLMFNSKEEVKEMLNKYNLV